MYSNKSWFQRVVIADKYTWFWRVVISLFYTCILLCMNHLPSRFDGLLSRLKTLFF